MKIRIIERWLLTVVMIWWWLVMPAAGYTNGANPLAHFTYMFSHANVWHLAGNLFVLWLISGRLYLTAAAAIAFFVSWLPQWSIYGELGMTLGFSGVLFAIGGIKWGVYNTKKYGRYMYLPAIVPFATRVLPIALLGIFVPHLNWCLHTYALLLGYIYGRCNG